MSDQSPTTIGGAGVPSADPASRTGPSLTRLPFDVREEICQRLHDAQTTDQINTWLATLGYGPFYSSAFTKFKQSRFHYQAWLAQQERLEEKRSRADRVRRELAADGYTTLDGAILSLIDAASDPDVPPVKALQALANIKSAVTAEKRLALETEKAKLEAAKFEFQKATALHQILSDEIARERARAIVADASTSKAEQIAALVALMNQMEQEPAE